jgi:hypothetical protein
MVGQVQDQGQQEVVVVVHLHQQPMGCHTVPGVPLMVMRAQAAREGRGVQVQGPLPTTTCTRLRQHRQQGTTGTGCLTQLVCHAQGGASMLTQPYMTTCR